MTNKNPNTKEFEWLAKLEFERLNHELGKKPLLSKITCVVEEHYDKINVAMIAVDGNGESEIECKKGCAMCCHTMVFANLAEIATAYMHIVKTFSKEEVAELKARLLASSVEITRSHAKREPSTVTCSLLKNNQCMIYKARPSQCRGAHSLNSIKCQQAFDAPNNDEEIIPIDPVRSEISNLMLSALSSSLKKKKLHHERYEFSTTLLSILESPTILQHWLAGKSPQ